MRKDVELLKIEIKNIKRNDIQKDTQQKVLDL